jgi:hypothetical protein
MRDVVNRAVNTVIFVAIATAFSWFGVKKVKEEYFPAPTPVVKLLIGKNFLEKGPAVLQEWLKEDTSDWLAGDWPEPPTEVLQWLVMPKGVLKAMPPKSFFRGGFGEDAGPFTKITLEQKLDPTLLHHDEMEALKQIVQSAVPTLPVRVSRLPNLGVFEKRQQIEDAKERITQDIQPRYNQALVCLKFDLLVGGVLATSDSPTDDCVRKFSSLSKFALENFPFSLQLPPDDNRKLNSDANRELRAHTYNVYSELLARLEAKRRSWIIGPFLDRFFFKNSTLPGAPEFLEKASEAMKRSPDIISPRIKFLPYFYYSESLLKSALISVPSAYYDHYKNFLFRGEPLQTILDIMANYTFCVNQSEMQEMEQDEDFQNLLQTGKVERAYISALLTDEEKEVFYKMVGNPTTWVEVNDPLNQPRRNKQSSYFNMTIKDVYSWYEQQNQKG